MSKFKMLLAAALVAILVVLVLATGNVGAGEPDGGGPHIIHFFLT